jgi:hypothetical protein
MGNVNRIIRFATEHAQHITAYDKAQRSNQWQ